MSAIRAPVRGAFAWVWVCARASGSHHHQTGKQVVDGKPARGLAVPRPFPPAREKRGRKVSLSRVSFLLLHFSRAMVALPGDSQSKIDKTKLIERSTLLVAVDIVDKLCSGPQSRETQSQCTSPSQRKSQSQSLYHTNFNFLYAALYNGTGKETIDTGATNKRCEKIKSPAEVQLLQTIDHIQRGDLI